MKKFFLGLSVVSLILTAGFSKSVYAASSSSTRMEISAAPTIKTAVFSVNGKCNNCKARIEKAAKEVKGVEAATWNLKTKKLSLKYNSDETNVETVSKAIARVGHDTQYDKATAAAYNALPSCCKYRESSKSKHAGMNMEGMKMDK